MKKHKKLLIGILLVAAAGVALFVVFGDDFINGNMFADDEDDVVVRSFEECKEAGYIIMESYPAQCQTPDGETFTEDIGNVLEMEDDIRINSPRPNDNISSPLVITGEARGTWFFEGDFPVYIYDNEGNELGAVPAAAQGEWMTEDFVPYEAELEFDTPATEKGLLVLMQDDPRSPEERGEDEVKELHIPVVFQDHSAGDSARAEDGCIITGCSGIVCAEEEVVTTCEYKPEYSCYGDATCARQASGECGWTSTEELNQCLEEKS